MKPIFTLILLICLLESKAQSTGELDSLSVDEIAAELFAIGLLDAPPKNMLDINVGISNGNFALQSDKITGNASNIFMNGGLGYYHKSGLSFSGGINFGNDGITHRLLQSYLAPAYDFYGKELKVGLAYYHFFNNPAANIYLSPLVNEIYAYASYKKWYVQPKFALDIAWGSVSNLITISSLDTTRGKKGRKGELVRRIKSQITQKTNPIDFSTSITLKHDYTIGSKKHPILYTPALSIVAGSFMYGSNMATNSFSGRRMNNQNPAALVYDSNSSGNSQPFELYNLNISQNAHITLHKFYVYGMLTFSYNLPENIRGLNTFFGLGAGLVL